MTNRLLDSLPHLTAYPKLIHLTTMPIDQAVQSADTLTVADYQAKLDEISAIRQAAKNDWSLSNNQKRQIALEFRVARKDLRAASERAMAAAAQFSSAASKRG